MGTGGMAGSEEDGSGSGAAGRLLVVVRVAITGVGRTTRGVDCLRGGRLEAGLDPIRASSGKWLVRSCSAD